MRNFEIIIVVIIPILLSLLMGFALSTKNISLPKIAILSQDEINKNIFPKMLFKEVIEIKNIERGKKLLEKGKVHGIITISKGLKEVKVILDDSESSKSMMIRTIVEKVLNKHFNISLPISLTFEKYRGLTPKQRMLPMWILMGIFMIGLTVIPKSISSEKEKKTLDALLLTPITETDFLLSKIIWGILLMVANVVILLQLNDGMMGNWLSVTVITLTGVIASASLGIFIATISPTESIASMISTFLLLIMILSSTIGQISDKAEKFTYFLPSYHLSEGFLKSALFNKDITFIWQHVLFLFVWGLFFMSLSFIRLSKREE
jgi:ABC-2 type transport system permease protein